jgi:hypothetical protein
MTREQALVIVAQLKAQRQQMFETLLPLFGIQSGHLVTNIRDALVTLDIEIKDLEEFLQ